MQTNPAAKQKKNIKWFESPGISPVIEGEMKNPSSDQYYKRY